MTLRKETKGFKLREQEDYQGFQNPFQLIDENFEFSRRKNLGIKILFDFVAPPKLNFD